MPAAAVQRPLTTQQPSSFGDYHVLGKIGAGGMAEIFLAYAVSGRRAGKPVALKRMHAHLANQERMRRMFLSEADIGVRLRHDNVCAIYDYGAVEDTYYIAMEYLHGGSLGGVLHKLSRKQRHLKLRFLGPIVDQVCAGLSEAHAQGIVHRDVSPNNIFLTVDGDVKLLDFGVAKASFSSIQTRTGIVKGTFAYMAPEQLKGHRFDARADVFSLGVVLHEAITCRRLFKRENDYHTCKAITSEPIPPMSRYRRSVPEALERVVAKALARDPDDRYGDVRELAADVRRALRSEGEPPSPEAIGREVGRLFCAELDDIDDVVGSQPTNVSLSRRVHRAPTAPIPVQRHSAGEVLSVLPLRAEVSVVAPRLGRGTAPPDSDSAVRIDTGRQAKLEPNTRTGLVKAPERPRRRSRAGALLAAALGLLLLAAQSTWDDPPENTGLPRPGSVSVPAD